MFKNKCWWITGASSGIGEALALALSEKGAGVILSGRNIAALEAVAKKCGDTLVLPFEATDFESLAQITEKAWAWKGGIDGLVNNAGISQRSLAVNTDFDVYQKIIDIDLLAPIALTQQLLPRMVAKGSGRLVCISSIAGIVGAPLRSAYSAAKHGIIGYHDAIRCETEHLGIQVHVIAPGSVKTNVSRNALNAQGAARGKSDENIENGMPASEAASRIVDAIEQGRRELLLAEGMELEVAIERRQNPEASFARIAQMASSGYIEQILNSE